MIVPWKKAEENEDQRQRWPSGNISADAIKMRRARVAAIDSGWELAPHASCGPPRPLPLGVVAPPWRRSVVGAGAASPRWAVGSTLGSGAVGSSHRRRGSASPRRGPLASSLVPSTTPARRR